jgi:hypothetical protein
MHDVSTKNTLMTMVMLKATIMLRLNKRSDLTATGALTCNNNNNSVHIAAKIEVVHVEIIAREFTQRVEVMAVSMKSHRENL